MFGRRALIIIAVFAVQWLLLHALSHPSWDSAFYYAYVHSAVYDGDLQLGNDLQLSYPAAPDFGRKESHLKLTTTGYVENTFAPGVSVQWLPWLAMVRPFSDNGFQPFILQTAATISAVLGLAAFVVMERVGRKFAPDTSLLATVTMMFATPLLFYQFRDPFYAHLASAIVATAVIAYWLRIGRQPTARQLFALGVLLGLGVLVRWQSVIYGVLPAVTLLWDWATAREKRLGRLVSNYLLVGVGAFVVISIQLCLWRLFFGSWITIPQGDSFINWGAPWLKNVFLSPFRGIIAWFPVFIPSLLGLLLILRKHSRIAVPLLLVILLQIYINSSTLDWFGGGGFGLRKFSSEVPILVIGYAIFIGRIPKVIRYLLLGGFAIHNWTLLRYGLSEKLGGRVVSMAPNYAAADEPWATFLDRFGSFVIKFVTDPVDFWVLHNSPAASMLDGALPMLHTTSLLMAVLVVGGGWWVWRLIEQSPTVKRAIPLILITTILLTNVWILWFA